MNINALPQLIFVWGLALYCGFLVWPFIPPILMGGVLAVLVNPLLRRFCRWGLGRLNAAILTTFITTLILLLPLSLLVFVGARTASEQIPAVVSNLDPQYFHDILHRPEFAKAQQFLRRSFGVDPDVLRDYIFGMVRLVGEEIAGGFGKFVSRIPIVTLYIIVTILSLLYFLHLGPQLAEFFLRHSVFSRRNTELLGRKFYSICQSLVLAALLIAIGQSAIFSLTCFFLGIEQLSVIGMVVFLMSFIPIVGSAPFTFTFAVYYLSTSPATGAVLLIAAGFISTVDNLFRPLALRQGASMNPIIALLAILGGLRVFGFTGIFLGPIFVGLLFESYRIVYLQKNVRADE